MNNYNELTGLYSLSKTLKFELKPIGKTLEHIETKGILAQDQQRAEDYEVVKMIIDSYHKEFISMCLSGLTLNLENNNNHDSLEEYLGLASKSKRDENDEKEFDLVKLNLRRQIVNAFKNGSKYADLFKKELIQKHLPELPEVLSDENKIKQVEKFKNFTTYFSGFQKNRENMYSDEEKSTAIAYRLINENLPMFIDNMKSFEKIANSEISTHFDEIKTAFKDSLNVDSINDLFKLENFTHTLTQKQIDIYRYVIGGKTEDDGTKIQGINEYVNLHNQQHKEDRLPLLKPLYKMILSDRLSLSWLPDAFSSDEQMIDSLNETYNLLKDVLTGDNESSLKNLLLNIDKFDTEHIYISNDLGLTDISQQMFGQYDVFTSGIKTELRNQTSPSAKEKRDPELYDDRINKLFKIAKSFPISYLNSFALEGKTIQSYFAQLGAYDRDGEQSINLFTKIDMARVAASDILAGKHTNINQSENDIKLIKDLLDAYKDLQHFIKPLLGNGDEADKDNEFDARLRSAWDALNIVTPLYNMVRSWLTRKPYSTEKIKLNFENKGDLLGGWVDSKTEKSDNGTQYGGYIFRKKNEIGEYDFFLGISSDTKLFRRDESVKFEDGMYERLDYYQLKGQTIFGSSYEGNYEKDSNLLREACKKAMTERGFDSGLLPGEEEKIPTYLKRIKNTSKDCLSVIFSLNEYEEMKKHILQTLSKLNRVESAVSLSKRENLSIDELFDAISSFPSKSFSYFPVSNEALKNANERDDKALFLFKITNKDLSFAETFSKGLRKSRGTDNLHTMYLKALLYMVQGVYDIGTGEVFFRKKTEGLAETTTIHQANKPILNKSIQNSKKKSEFNYDIIKNRHYTCDQFSLHLSIVSNYDRPKNYNLNADVQDLIRNNGVEHIIGIDRGERHLLYLTLIDLKGNIVKQMTLNDIINEYKGNTYTTNYKDLLATREGDRTDARRNWLKIENIKDLKEGYLSQVVHIIAKMMADYKAIVVLEDLNMGFMRGRQKIERNVYEQFEKKLIEKLNYYVDKQKKSTDNGGLLHALQLANKFESFKKLGKQSGCLFYIPAWNTSKIDPVTGFVNLFDTRYENVDKARCFFSKFDSIKYNADKDWFEFAFDYNSFGAKAEGSKTKWTLCTYGTRIKTFRNPSKNSQWDNEEVVLTNEFKTLFADAGIDINGNLKESICNLSDKKYLEPLMHLMKLLLQMRNSVTNSEIDYLLSPVADENGNFYDSRVCDDTLPKDADANGAYNIARKGLWVIDQIKQSSDKPRLAMTNKEWLQYAQDKPYLNE